MGFSGFPVKNHSFKILFGKISEYLLGMDFRLSKCILWLMTCGALSVVFNGFFVS